MSPRKSTTLSAVLAEFTSKNWTYGTAAKSLGVNKGHLHRVLHGERTSESLLSRVRALPARGRGRSKRSHTHIL